jgi:ribose 5-phosphate isomerase B
MRIALGADHGGVDLKNEIKDHLTRLGHDIVDVGTDGHGSVDYPDYAHQVARLVATLEVDRGVLCCGTGQGMAMSVNKHEGVRAAVVSDTFSAVMAMQHNDARVLCLGARVVGPGLALRCVDAWLAGEFEGGRHQRRVSKISPNAD